MKSKAPLVLMEQLIMVLVFALAAALCLQTFVLSEQISKKTKAGNRATIEAQNVAESMKASGMHSYLQTLGESDASGYVRIYYDNNWNVAEDAAKSAFILEICPRNNDNEYLWQAEIIVKTQEGTELIRILTAGQTEVVQYE